MTIAGYDPSAGAGVLADVKTFERLRCYGFAVQTANTIQTENQFIKPNWIPVDQILEQLNLIQQSHHFPWVKIGLVESLAVLKQIVDCLKENGESRIIWDPVLSASAGYDFDHDLAALEDVLAECYLVTPNRDEAQRMMAGEVELAANKMSGHCKILVTSSGKDELFEKGSKRVFKAKPGTYFEKHGSGCVLSSAITAHLALGYPLQKSILRSKRYIERYLASSPSLIGYHS